MYIYVAMLCIICIFTYIYSHLSCLFAAIEMVITISMAAKRQDKCEYIIRKYTCNTYIYA